MLISKRDLSALHLARQIALLSECRWRLGSVLINHGAILAVSPNIKRHDPRYIQKYTHHAEYAVLRMAGTKAKGSTVYTVRVGANGDLRESKPCSACIIALAAAGVSRVAWSDYNGEYQLSRVRELTSVVD